METSVTPDKPFATSTPWKRSAKLLLAAGAVAIARTTPGDPLTAGMTALLFVVFATALALGGWANAWVGRALRQHRSPGRTGALLLAVAARAGRAWSGRKRARAVDVAGRRELEALVEEHLAAPSRALLAEHREARIALGELSARYLSTGIPALEDSTADDVAPIRPA